jgi:hypothetical protein
LPRKNEIPFRQSGNKLRRENSRTGASKRYLRLYDNLAEVNERQDERTQERAVSAVNSAVASRPFTVCLGLGITAWIIFGFLGRAYDR